MTDSFRLLFFTLERKGFRAEQIPPLIENVLDMIGHGGEFTLAGLNDRLVRMGWEKEPLDHATLELIIRSFLKDEEDYHVSRHSLQ